MNPPTEERKQLRLEDIFHVACELPPDERQAYLDEVCADDDSLRRKAESMLRHFDDDDDFLEKPASDEALEEISKQGDPQKNGQPRELMIGRQIGNYRILGLLGKGGMGEVYLAHDLELDVDVVIKVLREEFKSDPEWMARFNREGRLNAELNHPNIAGIRYKGEVDGRQFLVFEFVPGETLEARLKRGTMPISQALPLFSQLAEALSFAHEKGIIHRDLKPANLMVTPDNRLKVLDFGIAKKITTDLTTIELNLSEDELTRDYGHTEKGGVIGTIVYMSPEQTRAENLDSRTDMWSFGCVLYEALVGYAPYKGVGSGDTLNLIRDSKYQPNWRALPPKTPSAIVRLLRRCFEKNSRRRLASAAEARQVIEKSLANLNTGPFSFWPKQFKQQVALVATMLVLLIASFSAGLRIWRWATDPIPKEKLLAVLPFKDSSHQQAESRLGGGLAKSLSEFLGQAPGLRLMPYSAVATTYAESVKMTRAEIQPPLALRSLGANLILSGEVRRFDGKIEIEYRILNSKQQVIKSNKLIDTESRFSELKQNLAKEIITALNIVPPREFRARAELRDPRTETQLSQAVTDLQGDVTAEQVEAVIAQLKSLVDSGDGIPRVQVMLAKAYMQLYTYPSPRRRGELVDEALKWLNLATEVEEMKNDPDALHTRGLILTELGQVKEAIIVLSEARARYPNHPDIAIDLAMAYNFYEPPDADTTDYLALAETTLGQVVAAWPNYWRVHNEKGFFYFSHNRYAEAVNAWGKVIELLPESYTGQVNLADVLFKLTQFDRAEEIYRRLVNQDANAVEALVGVGNIQFYRANYEAAALTYQQATQVGEGSATPWENLGDALRMLPGREQDSIKSYDKAIEQLQRIMRGNPDNAQAHKIKLAEFLAKRGGVKAKEGEQEAARNDRDRALNIARPIAAKNPQEVFIITSLVKIYHLAGNDNEAVKWVQKASDANADMSEFEFNPEFEILRAGNSEFQRVLNQHRK